MDTWRSGGEGESGGGKGGERVAVEEEEEEKELSVGGRNWKSAMRRSAHLLAEQTVVVAEGRWSLEGFPG